MRKVIVLWTLFFAFQARAAVPSAFSVEGVLRDSSGKLQSMMVNVSASLFDAQTAGNKLAGPYGPTMVMATNGLFSVPVGDASLVAELSGAAHVWLEVSVGNDTFARQPVTPQLYALMCSTADSLSGVLPVANGGTGSATQNFVDLTSDQTIAGAKQFSNTMVVDGSSGQFFLSNSGTAGVAPLTVDQSVAGGGAGLLIKGDTVGSNYPGMSLSLQNNATPPKTIVGGAFSGVITSATAGAESMDVILGTKATNNQIQERMRITSAGNVGIGTTTPAYPLDVNGNIRALNVTAPSDATLKRDVRTIDHALEDVERLRGVRFTWKKDGKQSIGVIAQELEQVYPELVDTAPDHIKSVDYMKLSAVLIEATKQQQRQIAELRARLDQIEHKQKISRAN